MIVWRVLPVDPAAADDAAGGPLWFPREYQGAARHDNPTAYGCLYVAQAPVSAVAEALAPFRGRGALTAAMLERAGRRLSLVALDLREPDGLLDLDEPQTLAAEGLRPSSVATRVRQRTQSDALRALRDPPPDDRPAMVVDHRGLVDQRHRLRPRPAAAADALGRAAEPRPRRRARSRGRARAGVTGAGAVHVLPVPTPFAVGRVNCYLVDDDPLTLVDAGPNSATSLTVLEAALGEHGRRIEDLERIVITHQHIDHIGLVQILADRSGAEVCALDALAPWLARYSEVMEADDAFAEAILLRHGIPQDIVIALRAVTRSFRAWGSSCTVGTPLADGAVLPFAGRAWRVHHRPGHSPSDTVFHDEASGELIGGDHLIKHISSNPLISRPLDGREPAQRPKALVAYLASLRATREMDLRVVRPGHGDPVEDHRALIDERFVMHERRAAKLHGLVAERPRTAHELAQELWGNVAVTQAYLTLSEVLGHVDLLLDDGRVVEEEADGVVHFVAAG